MTLKHVLHAGVAITIALLAGSALFFLGNQRLALALGTDLFNQFNSIQEQAFSNTVTVPEVPPLPESDSTLPESDPNPDTLVEEEWCRIVDRHNDMGQPFPVTDQEGCGEQGGEEPPPPPDGGGGGNGGGGTGPENTLALCTDGVDNDGDSKVDLEDSDCASFRPKLTVTLIVVNDNGGTSGIGDYSLSANMSTPDSADSVGLSSGIPAELTATGTWKIAGFEKSGYSATFSGDCNASGEVTLLAGETKTCTITSNDVAPGAPQCSDGVDNDNDSAIDGSDPGCSDASDDDETNPTNGGTSNPPSGGGGGGVGGGGGSALATQVTATTSAAQAVFDGAAAQITACDQYLTKFIRAGRENDPEQVRRLQAVLVEFEKANIEINGVYDDATLAAVHAFQNKYASEILTPWGIKESTGYVYLTTRKKVNEIYCHGTKLFPLTSAEQQIIEKARTANAGTDTGTASSPQTGTASTGDAASQAGAAAEADTDSLWNKIRGFFRGIRGR